MLMHSDYKLRIMTLVCLHQIVTMCVAVHILIKYELFMMSQLCGCMCLRL